MKKFITLLLLSTLVMANTGWSGRILNGADFESQIRSELTEYYKHKCFGSSKNVYKNPVIILTPLEKPIMTGFLGLISPKYQVEFDSYDTSSDIFSTQVFEVELFYNSSNDGFDFIISDDFELKCLN